ncbi:DUF4307 domain-containing protein [Aestuariimicrobium soli]|uniref:DUF4307 domain-containing protein n=1 Tax=Aestuariimicrobium soli TaxID=2035834 RepID=UPI003EBA82B4
MPSPTVDPNLARGVELTADDRERIRTRYPQRRRGRWIGAAVVIAVLLGGWAVWAGLEHANPGVTGQLHGYRVLDDQSVEATVITHRPDPTTRAECTVQAQALSGEIVGELTFAVTGDSSDQTQRVTIRTTLRATTAVLLHCRRA